MAHGRPKRLFRDDLGQDHIVLRVAETGAAGRQTRSVSSIGVAGAGFELAQGLGVIGDVDGRIADLAGLEEVRQVQFGRGARLDADGCTIQLLGRGNAQILLHHEALAVIVVHGDEIELEVGIARIGPGGVAGQQIDFARLQRRKAGLAGQGNELHLGRIAQDRSGDGAAQIDIKAGPVARRVRGAKTRQAGVRAAQQLATGLHIFQRAGRSHARNQRCGGDGAEEYGFFHTYLFLWATLRGVAVISLLPCAGDSLSAEPSASGGIIGHRLWKGQAKPRDCHPYKFSSPSKPGKKYSALDSPVGAKVS